MAGDTLDGPLSWSLLLAFGSWRVCSLSGGEGGAVCVCAHARVRVW